MLYYATVFLIIGLMALLLSFFAHFMAAGLVIITKICAIIFMALFIIFLIVGLLQTQKKSKKTKITVD